MRWLLNVLLALLEVLVMGCAMEMPRYDWHRATAEWQRTDADTVTLLADQDACLREANRLPGFLAPGAFVGDPVRRTLFKDCMEARGWQKEN